MDVAISPARIGLAMFVTAFAVLALALVPAKAAAVDCEFGWGAGGPSAWETDDSDGEFDEAALFPTGPGLDVDGRGDAFDGYGEPEIDGSGYSNPNTSGCTRQGRILRFPAHAPVANVTLRPELYVPATRPMGRQLVRVKNTGNTPVTVDFGWDGDLGSDSSTRVANSSRNPRMAAQGNDRWAVSCEDGDSDGCGNVGGEPDRDPELAHNWERKGKVKESANAIDLATGSGNFDVTFNNVRIGPGQVKLFMQVVHLAPTIKRATGYANVTDGAPPYVYAGIPQGQRRLLQNW